MALGDLLGIRLFMPPLLLGACPVEHPDSHRDGSSLIDGGADASALDAGSDAGVVDAGDEVPGRFRVALSVSPFAEIIDDVGLSWSDGARRATTVRELQELFMAHGATEVFGRISTERYGSAHGEDRSLARGLERAELASAVALPFNPELGLFGTYGDGSCQTAPDFSEYPELGPVGAWETLTIDEMVPIVRSYATVAAQALIDSGATIEIWDLGNEVDFGTAGVAPHPLPGSYCDISEGGPDWYRPPDGVDPAIGEQSVISLMEMPEDERIAWLGEHVWPHTARLLIAAAEGVRAVVPSARFSTHIAHSMFPTVALAFYDAMAERSFAPDEIGFSFYPSAFPFADRLTAFRAAVEGAREQFGVPIFLAEYAYPAEPMSGTTFLSTWNHELTNYPISEAGQHALLRDLVSWAVASGVSGIRPWAPEAFVGEWAPMALFSTPAPTVGAARTSLDAISEGLASPNAGALME